MKILVFLAVAGATATVQVRPYFANEDRCATTIHESCFDESLYKSHFNQFYNGIPTDRKCPDVSARGRRDVPVDVLTNFMHLKKNSTVYYLVSCNYSESERVFIATAMLTIESRTCIKFVPYDGRNQHFVYFDDKPNPTKAQCSANAGVYSIKYNGQDRIYSKVNFNRSCFKSTIYKGKLSLLHEIMHVIGFVMHQHDRIEATDYNSKKMNPSQYVTYGPYDRYSAVGYQWTHELTDLDALKVNRFYNCTHITRSGQKINLDKTTPVLRNAGPLKKVQTDCSWEPKTAYINVGHLTIDHVNQTLTINNEYPANDPRTTCEIDETCYLPFVNIRPRQGDYFYSFEVSDLRKDKCLVQYVGGANFQPQGYPITHNQKCTVVIQANMVPNRGGEKFICLEMYGNFKVVDGNGNALQL